MKKTDEQMKKTDEQIKELRVTQSETTEQIRELRVYQAETTEQIRELRVSQAKTETDEQMKKTDEQMKKTGEKLDSIGQQLGSMGHNIGDAAEEFFYRSLEESPKLGQIAFDSVERRIRKTKNDQEIDILLINGQCVALIEVKYNAHPQELHDLAVKKVNHFRQDHQTYKNHKLYFGIASMTTNPELITNAEKEGLFLLTQKGDHLVLANSQVKTF